jgi:hypothetical protein
MPPLGWRKDPKGASKRSSCRIVIPRDFDLGVASREVFVSQRKEKEKYKSTSKQTPRKPEVEEAGDSSSEREREDRSEVRILRKVAKGKKAQAAEILNFLGKAAAALAAIGGSEEVEAFLQANGIDEEEAIQKIRKQCIIIANLLPRPKSLSKDSSDGVPSTIAFYDQSFVYRASSSVLYLLQPVEVFKGTLNYNRKKVFGYLRGKGSTHPLMCALPGWTPCVEQHPRLLEPNLWTDIVTDFVNFHNHRFRTSPFDRCHERADGDTNASHVEPRLMLWFAIDVLQKMTGIIRPPSEQKGDIWMLKDIVRGKIEAEIILSRPPCQECLAFQEFLESYLPIKFSYIVMKNLGEVKLQKVKNHQKSVPLFAVDIDDSESESGFAPQVMEERTHEPRRIAVVIQQKPSMLPAPPAQPAVAKVIEKQVKPSGVSFSTTMTSQDNSGSGFSRRITVSQAAHLQQYYHTPKSTEPKKPRKQKCYEDDSDEQEWEPSPRSKSRAANRDLSKRPTKKVTRHGLLSPAQSPDLPFGPEALGRVQLHKVHRKRAREGEVCSTPRKKSKPSMY